MITNINGDPYVNAVRTYSRKEYREAASKESDAAVRSRHDEIVFSETAMPYSDAKNVKAASNSENIPDTLPETASETQFTSTAIEHVRYLSEMRDGIIAYYADEHKENLGFSDPERHVYDKYKNPRSEYFHSDMSEKERETAFNQEISLLRTGDIDTLSDARALKAIGMSNDSSIMETEINNRVSSQIGQAISSLFEQNGINLPKSTILTLTVDPYDFFISAEGADNQELSDSIEKLLNQGDNGKNLYYYLKNQSQNESGSFWKFSFFHAVKDFAGYDIRTLQNENGIFRTPDGEDLWDILSDKGVLSDEKYRAIYKQLAQNGWDSLNDYDQMSINYCNGILYDYDVSNSTESLSVKNNTDTDDETVQTGITLLDGTFSHTCFSKEEWQEKLSSIEDPDSISLSDKILKL